MRTVCPLLIVLSLVGCSNDEPVTSSSTTPGAAAEPVSQPSEPQQLPAADNDIVEKLQGTWVIVDANVGGSVQAEMNGIVAEIADNCITISMGGGEMKSTMTFDTSTDPVRFESAAANGQRGLAILKFDGDELIVCTCQDPESGYPESFEPGPGLMIFRYQRSSVAD